MLRVILNPASRGGAGRAVRAELARELSARGVEAEILVTERPGHATALAYAAAEAGADAVVAAGGDGTVHEVANGLLQAQDAGLGDGTALGLVPVGTGNDFVKVIPGTASRSAAYDTLAAGRRYPYDAVHVRWVGGEEYALNALGTGIDVEVVRQIARRSRRTGAWVYLAGLLRALRRFRPVHLAVTVDGERTDARVMMIAIANGTCIGGIFRICPLAQPDDGWLDLCVVRALPAWRQPGLALRVLRGRHAGHADVSFQRARRVGIEVLDGSPLYFQLDGELREPAGVQRLEVAIQPHRLQVIAAALPGGVTSPTPESESLRAS